MNPCMWRKYTMRVNSAKSQEKKYISKDFMSPKCWRNILRQIIKAELSRQTDEIHLWEFFNLFFKLPKYYYWRARCIIGEPAGSSIQPVWHGRWPLGFLLAALFPPSNPVMGQWKEKQKTVELISLLSTPISMSLALQHTWLAPCVSSPSRLESCWLWWSLLINTSSRK